MITKPPATSLLSVSEALRQLIASNTILRDDQISFNAPHILPNKSEPFLLVYLFQTTENSNLRNYEPPLSYASETGEISPFAKIEFPPTVLDLHYLFIPYGQDPASEIILIGDLKRLFRTQSILPPSLLPQKMRTTQIRAVPNDMDLSELHQLWSLFSPTQYKLSLTYTLTPVVLPSDESHEFTRTFTATETYYKLPWE